MASTPDLRTALASTVGITHGGILQGTLFYGMCGDKRFAVGRPFLGDDATQDEMQQFTQSGADGMVLFTSSDGRVWRKVGNEPVRVSNGPGSHWSWQGDCKSFADLPADLARIWSYCSVSFGE